jgi:hypothetical protein
MNPMEKACRTYGQFAGFSIQRYLEDDARLEALYQWIRDLHRVPEDQRADGQYLSPLFRFFWLSTRTALPLDDPWMGLGAAITDMSRQLPLLRAAHPATATIAQRIHATLKDVAKSPDTELRKRYVALLRKHPEIVIVTPGAGELQEVIARDARAISARISVTHATHGADLPYADRALVVGPLSDYPEHLSLAPRFKQLINVAYRWRSQRPLFRRLPDPQGDSIPQGGRFAEFKTEGVASIDTRMLERYLDATGRDSVPAETVHRAPVIAQLVRLAEDHYILYEPESVVRVFAFVGPTSPPSGQDGASHAGVTTEWIDLESVEPGMFILERTRSDALQLTELSRELLGQKHALLTKAHAVFKESLRALVGTSGIRAVEVALERAGCSGASDHGKIRGWMGDDNILPANRRCLDAIMHLAGRTPHEADLAWKAGRALQVGRQQAGVRISKLLVRMIGTRIDREALKKSGGAEVHLHDSPGGASMKLLRIEGFGPRIVVPPRQLRVVLNGLTQFSGA